MRLALVSCPVALFSARHDRGTIRFNMINPVTGNRVRMISVDAGTDQEISRSETVKGFEYAKNRYVVVTDADLETVKVDSSSTMAIDKFVDASSIDPIHYDASYYLAPDGKDANDVYAVMREAIAKTGRVALTRLVISQRERTVAVRPIEGGLVAHTLNEQRDLNDARTLFETVQGLSVDPEMVTLAVQLIDRQTAAYDPSDLEDRYESRLRAMLDAKIKGEAVDEGSRPPLAADNVVDIMAALRQSLGMGSPSAQPPVKAVRVHPAKRDDPRTQPALKLPIAGGKDSNAAKAEAGRPEAKPTPAPRRRKAS